MREPLDILKDLHVQLAPATTAALGTSGEGAFDVAFAAALAKTLEFAQFTFSSDGEVSPFFATATLRGICEDLITLRFVLSLEPPDRAQLIYSLAMSAHARTGQAQEEFFNRERPSQPIIGGQSLRTFGEKAETLIERLKEKYNWRSRRGMPSVYEMSRQTGLQPLYQYLYHATSRWVHFEPSVLLRMGWSSSREPDTAFQFSTENFKPYYLQFNQFYSVYLVVQFLDAFASEIKNALVLPALTAELREYLDEHLRWPELITFEEMNVKAPSEAIRLLMHAARRVSSGKDISEASDTT
jgi:hypothetical protein